MLAKFATIKKSVAAFLASTLTSVPLGLATAAKWWAAAVPFVTALVVFLSPKNAE